MKKLFGRYDDFTEEELKTLPSVPNQQIVDYYQSKGKPVPYFWDGEQWTFLMED